jgi:hypothetical protein
VAGLVAVAGASAWLLAAQLRGGGEPSQDGPPAAAIRAFEEKTGVHVVRVAVTGQGGIVDLRYRVLAEHSPFTHDASQHPAILDEQTGEVIGEPFMGMWHHHEFAEPGDTLYQLFVNRQGLIEPGEHVSVRLGGATLRDVPVE